MRSMVSVVMLAAGCAAPTYDGPAWGDPCVPRDTDSTLYVCRHGDPLIRVQGGYCEPSDQSELGGACRPWCGPGNACPDGTEQRYEPRWAFCYCAEL